VVLATALAALAKWIGPSRVLTLHSAALCLSGVALILWALKLLLVGLPEEGFVWMPGILTGWVAYASTLGVRFLVRDKSLAYFLPAYAMLAAAVIDVGVLARAL
jgi:hypothetical protein